MEVLHRPSPLGGNAASLPEHGPGKLPFETGSGQTTGRFCEGTKSEGEYKLDSLRAPTRKWSRFDGFCKSGTEFGFVISLIKFILFWQYGRSNGRSCIKSIWVKD